MAGRVLIVDPVVTTRIVLKVKLAAAYFNVAHAATMEEALRSVSSCVPDIVLCDYYLNGGGAVALQDALKGKGIPVIGLLPEDATDERANALAAGLGDVISRPYEDRSLLARIRSILRARTTQDEHRLRRDTSDALGFAEQGTSFAPQSRVGLLCTSREEGEAWRAALSEETGHQTEIVSPGTVISRDTGKCGYDALLVSLRGACAEQRLDFVSSLRAQAETRNTMILAISPEETAQVAITALDTGAGDVMTAGFEPKEAAQRLTRLLSRRHREKALQQSVSKGLEAAVTDPLTGLYNRRYALPYLERMASAAQSSRRCFAIMVLDLDYFKRVNDDYGHSVGDAVLTEFADRLRSNLRSVDLVARIGGEEFLVALPDTTLEQASYAAKRLCRLTRSEPFARTKVPGGIPVSVSVGLALGGSNDGTQPSPDHTAVSELIERADDALYEAKAAGRDAVRICRSAAA